MRRSEARGFPDDYRFVLVLYGGMLAVFAGLLVYGNRCEGWAIPWRTSLFALVILTLIFQTGITFLLASVARRPRTRKTGYVLAAVSFALLLSLPALSNLLS